MKDSQAGDSPNDGATPADSDMADVVGIDRRAAIKKGVAGAVAAGVVWSAPKIEGLSLRPNYAAASSAGGGPGQFTVNIPIPAGTFDTTIDAPGIDGINIVRSDSGSADIDFRAGGQPFLNLGDQFAIPSANLTPGDWFLSLGGINADGGANNLFISSADLNTSGSLTVTYNCA